MFLFFFFFKKPNYPIQCIVQTIVVVATRVVIGEEILTSTSYTNVEVKENSNVLNATNGLLKTKFLKNIMV